ncbi:PAS domain-containing sensor histidine kinase [Aureimonas jatrophae]|uniref:Blue-light-activated histidine kinase n=1 Tax=Aureimonas jatrophae TaxID=1166073 RepID=A0A1H0KAR9_9HYPH|nr:PAS domain-containing protein [Aureimonas jatrophae]MBB3951035.1 PAS domain S-box-containing protein [Aureimonas jatrophae]SDO52976.1 PAS domain S-box-containing protein [Aureimonas jatrophae]
MRRDEPAYSPARDRQIIQSITEFAIIATDREGIVTDWNAGAEQILGWSAREMVGRTAELFFTPEDRKGGRAFKEMTIALETGRALDERWHLKSDGSRFWASGEMMPLRDDDDRHIGFVKVLRDRTDYAVAQRARRDDQEQLEAIFSQSPSFMALLRGPEHRFERANPGYVKLVGGRDVVGRTVAEALPEAVAQGFIDLLDDVYRRGQPHHATETPITLQASPDVPAEHLFLDFVYQPIRDADGSVVGIFVEGVDVTERVAGARRLREAEDRYRALAENVDVGMCVIEMKFDGDGKAVDYRIVDGNPAYERHTGLYGSVGKWVSEIAPGLERHWFDTYGHVALTGEPARFELGATGLGNRMFEVEAHRVGDPDRHHVAILFTDVTDRRRAVTDLANSERKWRSLFENLHEGFILGRVLRDAEGRVTDWRYEEVNRAWGELVGIPSTDAAGRTIRQVFPGIEDAWVNEFADVVETGETIRFTRQVGTLGRWYDGVCHAIGDDRFTVIFLDVTDRIQAEARREAIAELALALSDLTAPNDMAATAARIIGQTLGVGRVGYGTVAGDGETFTVPSDWTAEGYPSLAGVYRMDDYGGYAEDLRQGRTVVIPDIWMDPRTAGDIGPLERVCVRSLVNLPIVENGRTVAVLYVNDDEVRDWRPEKLAFIADAADRMRNAVERRRAEEELRDSESFLRSVLTSSSDCIKVLDLDGNLVFMSEGGMKVMEVSDFNDIAGCPWPDFYTADDSLAAREALVSARAGVSASFQGYADTLKGNHLYWDVQVSPIFGANGKPERILSVSRDISALKASEEARAVLNAELAHRMKNTLAMVQAITTQTLRQARTMDEGRTAVAQRLSALGRAQDILTRTNFTSADVGEVVSAAIAPHHLTPDRITWEGPRFALTSQQALGLSLAVHELATNAAKYGALSNETGRVAMSWDVVDGTFCFRWIETGGPAVVAPDRRGFGSRLIERIVGSYFDGEGHIEFDPSGVRFTLTGAAHGTPVAA